MTNPYQPPPLNHGDTGSDLGWLSDFFLRLPTLSLAYATWLVWVWFVSYDSRYSGSDDIGVFLFSAANGLFVGKLYRGSIRMKVLLALTYSTLPLILLLLYKHFVLHELKTSGIEVTLGCTIYLLGALSGIFIVAKLIQLICLGWESLRRRWRRTAVMDVDSIATAAAIAIVSQRIIAVFLPLALFQILERAVLSVRVYWFHDFMFIDPWLWFTAPIAFGLTIWAFHPTWRNRSWFKVAISYGFAVGIAAALLLLAVPLGNAIAALLDQSSKPETRWVICNVLIAFAWFYSGFVRDFIAQQTHTESPNSYD